MVGNHLGGGAALHRGPCSGNRAGFHFSGASKTENPARGLGLRGLDWVDAQRGGKSLRRGKISLAKSGRADDGETMKHDARKREGEKRREGERAFGNTLFDREDALAEGARRGLKPHAIQHSLYGCVDEVWVNGQETPEELAAFERATFERLGLTEAAGDAVRQNSATSPQDSLSGGRRTLFEDPIPVR